MPASRITSLTTSVLLLSFGLLFADTPNIILMMADDMGMGDTSAYQDITGNADNVQIHTPQMERLARMGIRFTDAHTPTSRCTGTRYGLLTGRYPWRSRLKHWVLFGAQGDPLIEADRPTIASMLKSAGYRTGIVGKWHVGLRYRQSNGQPAAGWKDADLTQPLHTGPLDYGFDFARITSRSHGTSGPDAGNPNHPKNKGPNKRGPGHIHGRDAIGAVGGRRLEKTGPNAYVLTELGGRHSDSAIEFLQDHVNGVHSKRKPFFLYYPSNSNHGPYTPDTKIAGVAVAGAARTKSGQVMDKRHDFIFENDAALGRLMDWLEKTNDPRNAGNKLIENTLVIFTSDNGAEIKSKVATGPFRSNKGSAYEGGHRIAFIAAWPKGGVGDGDQKSPGKTNDSLVALQDVYATFAEICSQPLPDLVAGEKGAEDSLSMLRALKGEALPIRPPLFHSDHNEAKSDRAACAVRLDIVSGSRLPAGKWKLFFDASLIRFGKAEPKELYDLATDPKEATNLVDSPKHRPLLQHIIDEARLHRGVGGHRLVGATLSGSESIAIDLRNANFDSKGTLKLAECTLHVTSPGELHSNANGLSVNGEKVDSGEEIEIRFDQNVIVESLSIRATEENDAQPGNRECGGFFQIGAGAPRAIYCVNADNDTQNQKAAISDIGVLAAGRPLKLSSKRHFGVENTGSWVLEEIQVRKLGRSGLDKGNN